MLKTSQKTKIEKLIHGLIEGAFGGILQFFAEEGGEVAQTMPLAQ